VMSLVSIVGFISISLSMSRQVRESCICSVAVSRR
jgi:hypothetical protein